MADRIIDYDHLSNRHTLEGARAAFAAIAEDLKPKSVLDFGCGMGTWLHAAVQAGVETVVGVDGVPIPQEKLLFPASSFILWDLTHPVDLGRQFDVALCLEVAEHLPENAASTLIDSVTRHSDRIVFSAAVPGQPGQHHVHCKWPAYWQSLFNSRGYACNDAIRWRIWDNVEIEPWYRQNMFIAVRSVSAGQEPRIPPVLHPEILPYIEARQRPKMFREDVQEIEHGRMPLTWYAALPLIAIPAKLIRRIGTAKSTSGNHRNVGTKHSST